METVKHMPKVSVCVVTYNPDKGKLMETLESIVKQKYDNLQIVLSDDGSKENFFDEAKTLLDGVEFTDYQLLPAVEMLIETFKRLESENEGIVKSGRTHLQDATPIKFSQEISGWRASLERDAELLKMSVQP